MNDFSSKPHLLGFTLAETLISLGILSSIAAIGFGAGIDSFERALARSDRTTTLWDVLQARAEATNGICSAGPCVVGISQNVNLDSTYAITFEAISGLVADPKEIVLANGANATNTLSVNAEGQITHSP